LNISNLGRRTLVAIFGIPLILSCLYWGGWFLVALVVVITAVSQYEFFLLATKKGAHPLRLSATIIGIPIPIAIYVFGINIIVPYIILAAVIFCLIELFRNKTNALLNVASSIMGIIYPTILFSFMILIRELPVQVNEPYVNGGVMLIAIIVMIWICDTAAYFVGRSIGKHKLYFRISPNKTIEGAVAGFIATIATGLLFHHLFPAVISPLHGIGLGVGIGILSQLGDLVESAFKRDAAVKDSSDILPGHGGFLDRFDAPIIVAPLAYFYLTCCVYSIGW
jgi:phosphatidate cytidylyltransferase